jgi:predicted amidohydrolase YtcJ
MNFSEREMEAVLRESLSNDDQLLVHIVGDRTTEIFLNAMDATGGKGSGRGAECGSSMGMESCPTWFLALRNWA